MKLKYYFKCVADFAVDLFYPKHCAVCQKLLMGYTDTAVCKACAEAPPYPKVVRNDRHAFDEAIGAVKYSGDAKDAMLKFKFKSIRYYAKAYAYLIDRVSADRPYLKDAVMCSVPLSKSRDRAYNQTALIADELAKMWNCEYMENLLYKSREVSPLSKMKLPERKFYIKNAIDVNPVYDIYGKDILVIDDIYTSGTTADECAKVLKMHGASRVFVLCACYD